MFIDLDKRGSFIDKSSAYFDNNDGLEGDRDSTDSIEIRDEIYNDVLLFSFKNRGTYISKVDGIVRMVLDDEVYDLEEQF